MELVSCETFRVKAIPAPVARFAGKQNGDISIAELCAQWRLYTVLENLDIDIRFPIVTYTVEINHPNKESIYYTATDDKITTEMRDEFARSENGTIVLFQNIVVIDIIGRESEIGAIELIVKK